MTNSCSHFIIKLPPSQVVLLADDHSSVVMHLFACFLLTSGFIFKYKVRIGKQNYTNTGACYNSKCLVDYLN